MRCESRVANDNTFMSDELKKFVQGKDIKPIGLLSNP